MPNVLSQKLDFFLKVSTVFSDFQLENRELACVAGGGGLKKELHLTANLCMLLIKEFTLIESLYRFSIAIFHNEESL